MNKPLTQNVFKDAPEWVKSASVDSDGEAQGHEVDEVAYWKPIQTPRGLIYGKYVCQSRKRIQR